VDSRPTGSVPSIREGEDEVAIKVIVELQAKPGRRGELQSLLESLVADHGPSQRGFLGSTRYEVLDDPDLLVEIADWESAEARAAHMEESAASGAYAPLLELLAAPFRATVIRQLP
jgi:quinol monooxygenase YgiN